MQKVLIGILATLVLFLAATNVRLSDRARLLEERLAAEKPRNPSKRPPDASPTDPAARAESAAQVPASAPVPAPTVAPPSTERVAVAELGRSATTAALDRMLGELEGKRQELSRSKMAWSPGGRLVLADSAPAPEPEVLAGPRPGFLGISGEDVPGGGVKIQAVIPDSVALWSGLQPNDVILEYNGEPIDTLATLTDRVRSGGEGAPVSLRLRRNGVEFYQGVQLGGRR